MTEPATATGVVLRPVKPTDAELVWDLLAPAATDVIGMSSLPSSLEAAKQSCEDTAQTVAALATDSFTLDGQQQRRLLFVAADTQSETALGLTGVTFKHHWPNLAVKVSTSEDGHGLIMAITSAPWTRTELDSPYLGPQSRGRRIGSLLSRGRFMLLHLVHSQIPTTVASHLRGRFDDDGSAPFWGCFGLNFAPEWQTSTEAEIALIEQPNRLAGLADHMLPLTAPVLDSLGPVNDASLPAFHMLRAEGLDPNGMYDPIDGGPTLRAELANTVTGQTRSHGRVVIDELNSEDPKVVDSLVSVTTVARFRATRAPVILDGTTARLSAQTAATLGIGPDTLVVAAPL